MFSLQEITHKGIVKVSLEVYTPSYVFHPFLQSYCLFYIPSSVIWTVQDKSLGIVLSALQFLTISISHLELSQQAKWSFQNINVSGHELFDDHTMLSFLKWLP